MISKQQRFSLCVTVSVLLGVWMDVASGMSSIQLIPQYPVIQGSVTLSVTGITGTLTSATWYRGSNASTIDQILSYFPNSNASIDPVTLGPQNDSRITPHPNGSLQISNLIIKDEGNYTVRIQTDKPEDIRVYLKIYEIVGKPTITTSTPQPKENDTIKLTCNSTNAEGIVWSRISSGANLPSGTTLSPDNRTISLSRINRSYSGDYVCEGSNPVSQKKSDLIKITVAYGPENVKVAAQSLQNSLVSLECSADSVPEPTYQWRLNGTLIDARKNTIKVDQMKMENKGNYTCVANNSVTHLSATVTVYVNATIEFPEDPKNWGLIIGIVIAVILVLVLVVALVYLFVIHRQHKKDNKSTTINGQSNFSAETQEKSDLQYASITFNKNMPKRQPEKPDLQYASVIFNKNMPRRQPPPPDSLYANRAALEQPPETVYSDIRLK